MRQRHTEIIRTQPTMGQPAAELVQSTDRSWHIGWLFLSALLMA